MAPELQPCDLTCGQRCDPLGIDTRVPRLGWALRGGGRGAVQGAWQVQVGSVPGAADVWDSGRVDGDRQLDIAYGGRPLTSRTRYHWRVRVWDGAGREGPWSDPAVFETAYLDHAEFPGRWIGMAGLPADARRPLAAGRWLRPARGHDQPFTVWSLPLQLPAGIAVRSAVLHAFVERHGRELGAATWRFLAVNGTRLDAGEHLPPSNITTYDVRPWLRPGDNHIAVRLPVQAEGAWIAVFEAELDDGTQVRLPTTADGAWRCRGVGDSGWGPAAGPVAWADTAADGWMPGRDVGAFGAGPWPADDRRNQLDRCIPALVFRRRFLVRRPVTRARIHATACGVYELAIDGQPLSDAQLAPGWTDYRQRIHYQTYDATTLLPPGWHELTATVGDGWWCGHIGKDFGHDWYGTAKALRLALHADSDDGSVLSLATGDDWQVGIGEIRQADLLDGQVIDRTAVWTPGQVVELPAPAGLLQAQPDAPVRRLMQLPVRALTMPAPGIVVLDFGQNLVGHVRLRLRAPRGTVVTVRHAEVLDLAGRAWMENLRSALATDRFVCSGRDDDFAPTLAVHGFRYAEIAGLPGGLAPDQAEAVVVGSPTPERGTFACDDPLLNRLHANIRWGQRGNFLSIPTDCPQRDERMGWTADTQVFARTAIHNADCAAFYRKWLQDLCDGQHASGAFPDYAPAAEQPERGRFGWADAGIVVPWTLWRCYGDAAVVETMWDAMARYLASRDAGGDLNADWSYGDWVAPPPQTPHTVLGPIHHAWMHRLMAEMAAGIGRRDAAAHHRARFAAIRAAWRARDVAADGRIHAADTQTAYASAVMAGTLEPGEAAAHLVRAVERHGWHLHTGFLGTACLLPALSRCGRDDVAWRLLTAEGPPGWLAPVRNGATTMWERWDAYDPQRGPVNIGNMNSYNHYAFGAVGQWMHAQIAGIDRAEDDVGFQRLVFRPVPGGMCRHAAATFRSPRGDISCSWSIAAGRFRMQVVVPPNCSAVVHVPVADAASVSHDGAERKGHDAGSMTFTVAAGHWSFSASW